MESPDIEKSEATNKQINSNTNCNSKQQVGMNFEDFLCWGFSFGNIVNKLYHFSLSSSLTISECRKW